MGGRKPACEGTQKFGASHTMAHNLHGFRTSRRIAEPLFAQTRPCGRSGFDEKGQPSMTFAYEIMRCVSADRFDINLHPGQPYSFVPRPRNHCRDLLSLEPFLHRPAAAEKHPGGTGVLRDELCEQTLRMQAEGTGAMEKLEGNGVRGELLT